MQMDAQDVKDYPKFAKYVKEELPKVADNAYIRYAMSKIGELSQAKLKVALTWGLGPKLKLLEMHDVYGKFTPGTNEIKLDLIDCVRPFEKGTDWVQARAGKVHLAGAKLLHELVHWGDDQDRVDNPKEEGDEFEKMVYGGVLHKSW